MKKTVLVVALIGGALFFSGCKNNDGGGGVPACPAGTIWSGNQCIANGTFPGGIAGNMCPAGQLQTQYGCLPGGCQGNASMATYNGQCIPGTLGGLGQNPYGNQYLGGMYPNGYPYGYQPYGSMYNQMPWGYSYYYMYGF
ncbi:MAG: hypothetical protein A4S09_07675 [Proteobacteria bacterium SG_bin7]|nr:MAG: hypothetical protein A4S09_07675 [Proteobacteria bacterium SG_bin7]